MSQKAPDWLPTKTLEELISEVQQTFKEEDYKKQVFESIVQKVKSLPSIKDCTIDPKTGRFTITAYNGLTKTNIGGEIGTENAATISTGWSNFFGKGEAILITGKLTQNHSPSVNITFTLPNLKETDFKRENPYQKFDFSINLQREMLFENPIDSVTATASMSAGTKPFQTSITISSIKQQTDNSAPFPLRYEPSPYFKLALQLLHPKIQPGALNQITLGLISTSTEFTPYIKTNISKSLALPYGIQIFTSGGFMSSLLAKDRCAFSFKTMRPMPFPEKFFVGGVPSGRGVADKKFGYAYGGFTHGLDMYASATIEEKLLLFPQYQINGHIFVSGIIGRNFSSYYPWSCDPDWSALAVAGVGATFVQGPLQIEANVQMPLYQTGAKNTVLKYQFGISPKF